MDLYNKVKKLAESTLPEKLANYLDADVESMKDQVKKLTFSDYLKLANAIETLDDNTIRQYIQEADNPFSKPGGFSKPGDNNGKKAVDELRPGDEMSIEDDKAQPNDDANLDATIKYITDKSVTVQTHRGTETLTKDEVEQQLAQDIDEDIKRIRKLSGVEEDASAGATCAGAIASVAMPMGKIKKRKK